MSGSEAETGEATPSPTVTSSLPESISVLLSLASNDSFFFFGTFKSPWEVYLLHHNPLSSHVDLIQSKTRDAQVELNSAVKHSGGNGSGVTAKEDFPCGNARPSCREPGML